MGRRKPLPYLLDEDKARRGTRPSLLHYGFALQVEHVMRYAKKHDLIDKRCGDNRGLMYVSVIPAFLERLEWMTGVRLHHDIPYSCDHHLIISLYSNYTKSILKLDEGILREELELGEDEQPLWWFDKNQ